MTTVKVEADHEWEEDGYNCDTSFHSNYKSDHEDHDTHESDGLVVDRMVSQMVEIDEKQSCDGALDKLRRSIGPALPPPQKAIRA